MRHLLLTFILLFSLNACAPGTVDEVRAMPDAAKTFTVERHLEESYSIVLNRMQECWQRSSFLGGGFIVNHELRPKAQTATVSLVSSGAFTGNSIFLLVDMRHLAENKTEVTVRAGIDAARTREYQNSTVHAWILREKTDC